MFQDTLLPNLLIFAIGLSTAFFWLRTGMFRRGFLLLTALAVLVDIAVVARFLYEDADFAFAASLGLMQAMALAAAMMLCYRLSKKRWSVDSRNRKELLASATTHYLRDELQTAAALYRRVRRVDPWNVAATIGMANVRWRQGVTRKARALFRRAARLDRGGDYQDFILEQLRRLEAGESTTQAP